MNDNDKDSEKSKRTLRRLVHWHWVFAAVLVSLPLVAFAQDNDDEEEDETEDTVEAEELEDAPVVPAREIEVVIATGTRIQQNAGELAGQVLVLDEDAIRASGEATLERLLRQLPQNLNPTTERFGQQFNLSTNLSGASSVNLRGLGSESTLVLIDGKRIGHNGILGGVTDVSSIPLAMVERVEVVLDGASAIYGSDAVGGVVNVITRKDYEGVELNLNFDTPDAGGYNETRGGVSTSQEIGGFEIRGTVQHTSHTGLDASDREVTLFDQSNFAGPQYDVRFCCLADGTSLPILWMLGSDVLTRNEYNALSADEKAQTVPITHAVLPVGFNSSSSVDDITQFGEPLWGADTQQGFSVLPETTTNSFIVSVGRDLTDQLRGEVRVRGEVRSTLNNAGYISLSGQSLHRNSPFNPFHGQTIHLRGQRQDLPQPYTETDRTILDFNAELIGWIPNSEWEWTASAGRSSSDSDSGRYNTMDLTTLIAGMNSDGVTPTTQFLFGETAASCAEKGGSFFFGFCRVSIPPPPAIDPFGDLTVYTNDVLKAASVNTQNRFEATIKGDVFTWEGGTARVLFGASLNTVELDSETEFQIGVIDASPVGDTASYSTVATRDNSAIFFEGSLPVVGSANARPWMRKLLVTLSARQDKYEAPDITYSEPTPDAAAATPSAPGSEATYGVGLVYSPQESLTFRLNQQTAFVAPQLNQLLIETGQTTQTGFRRLLIQQPDGSLAARDTVTLQGGNPDLMAETAETVSGGVDVYPPFLPSIGLKATWSETEYENRITQLSSFIIDPENLPTNTSYDAANDIYFQDRRYINVSEVRRSGVDYELFHNAVNDLGEWAVVLKRSVTLHYDYVADPAHPERVSVVERTSGGSVIPVVPKNVNAVQLGWKHRGLRVDIDYSKPSKTTGALTGVTRVYSPPGLIDLTVGYDMAPGGLIPYPDVVEGGALTFTINNFGDSFGKSESVNANGEPLEQTYTDSSPLYGRFYHLGFRFAF